ncbi:MAG: CBS domain-containing protein [Deltaproteobacteria bacterium]|nr:MAG: CBS domain-containing protein [Deltaproteobacteria bacterium]
MERDAQIVLVHNFMTSPVRTIAADLEIDDALHKLRQSGHSGAPVVDDAGQVVGVLSEVDCMRVLASAAFHGMPSGPVAAYMTRSVLSLSPDNDIFMAVARFQETRFRRFPVVDQGKLVGIVTVADIDEALWKIAKDRKKLKTVLDHPPGAAWDPRR